MRRVVDTHVVGLGVVVPPPEVTPGHEVDALEGLVGRTDGVLRDRGGPVDNA